MNGPVAPRGRRPLGAHLTGYGAVWAYNVLADRGADAMRRYFAAGREDVARSIADAVAELREAARQVQEARDETTVSRPGSAEADPGPGATRLERLGDDHPGFHREVDVRAASGLLKVSERRVRQLLAAGDLSGRHNSAGHWLVDEDDLHRLLAERRTA